jgi:DinB superfamily
MHARLATALEALERQTAATLSVVQDWSNDQLAYRPAAGEWSAVEVLDHLERVERGITTAARRGLLAPHPIGLRDRIGVLFIDRVFQSERRVTVPSSAAQVLPDPQATKAIVDVRWAETRAALTVLLDEVCPDQLAYGVWRHPVGGWMSMPQVLRFFTVHLHHHRFQLTRLADALR